MLFLTFVKLFHLLGLILGFGGAILLDATVFTRGVIRPVSQYTIHQAEVLSRVVTLGLVMLWTSGAALIWINLATKPEYLTNQKLWAKIAIVVVLTLNGILIHHKVLPLLKERLGKRLFEDTGRVKIAALTLIGSISFVSWTTPFILGKASELNYVTPMWEILAFYGAAIAIMWVGMFIIMSSIAMLQKWLTKAAEMTMLNSDHWENADLANVQPVSISRHIRIASQHPLAQAYTTHRHFAKN
jgi:hypothetical protein